jgi:hypothetical protein
MYHFGTAWVAIIKEKGGSIMHDYAFTLKQLFFENMGSEPFYLRNFRNSIEYLDEPFSDVTLQVIRLLLGDMQACDTCCHADSRIEARVLIGEVEYTVMVIFQDGVAMFYVTDDEGKDRTLWYLQTVARTPEEQEVSCFTKPGVYPVRLYQYQNSEELYPGNFREATCGIGTSQTFRHYLQRFIRGFQKERLLPEKDYWLQPEKDGRFFVRLGRNGRKHSNLSKTDHWVFQYMCFLHLLRFWKEMRKRCRFPALEAPVLIRDFSDQLDESTDFKQLLVQAEALERQVLVFQ